MTPNINPRIPVPLGGLTQDEAFGGVLFSKIALGQAVMEVDFARRDAKYKPDPHAGLQVHEKYHKELMNVIDRQWVRLCRSSNPGNECADLSSDNSR